MNKNEYLKQIGSRIRKARISQRISANQLCRRCTLESHTIYKIESGRVNPYFLTLVEIATALKMDVKEFL